MAYKFETYVLAGSNDEQLRVEICSDGLRFLPPSDPDYDEPAWLDSVGVRELIVILHDFANRAEQAKAFAEQAEAADAPPDELTKAVHLTGTPGQEW